MEHTPGWTAGTGTRPGRSGWYTLSVQSDDYGDSPRHRPTCTQNAAGATKSVLLRLLTLHREDSYMQFSQAIKRAGAVRTLESLARIELASQGGALVERVTTTRTTKDGTATTTVRERFTAPDWHADGWFLERRHPADWSRRTELVLPDHEQAVEADPLVGVHDELRLARLARQKRQGKSV